MAIPSQKKLAEELTKLREDDELVTDEGALHTLTQALLSRDPPLVTQAADMAAKHTLYKLAEPLVEALGSLSTERTKLDAGCLARTALLSALDALDHSDAGLFAEAAQYEQLERMKGGTRDTAAPVRARGVLGLARLGHRDFLPIMGACLGDADGTVRLSAARALGHRGQRDGAGLLLLCLAMRDNEPEIHNEALRALFALAPDLAQRKAKQLLRSEQREQTLHALGGAPDDSAIELLIAELAQQTLSDERQPIIEALGLSLRPRARAHLLSLLDGEREADAAAALSALAIHRYDARLVEQLRAATAHSRSLSSSFRELYER